MDWSRPGHTLRSSTNRPDASPVARSVSKRIGPGGVGTAAPAVLLGAALTGGGSGAFAARRVPAGTRASFALSASVNTTGARAA